MMSSLIEGGGRLYTKKELLDHNQRVVKELFVSRAFDGSPPDYWQELMQSAHEMIGGIK